jgi:hypothetical protein
MIVAGCVTGHPVDVQYFRVAVGNESFVLAITDAETIKLALANMAGGNRLHPIGTVALGNGGFNRLYHWHVVAASVRMVELSAELCDGRPRDIEQDPGGWIARVKQYCPWSGRIVERLSIPR